MDCLGVKPDVKLSERVRRGKLAPRSLALNKFSKLLCCMNPTWTDRDDFSYFVETFQNLRAEWPLKRLGGCLFHFWDGGDCRLGKNDTTMWMQRDRRR